MTTCDRCRSETFGYTGSYFNTEVICFECREIEEQHPEFEKARDVECEHVRRGNMNFPGVGLPVGYAAWAAQQRIALKAE